MSKIEIPPVPSGFATTAALNARLQQIEDTLNNDVLYRSDVGNEPNAMESTLDMAENRIINLPDAVEDSHPVTYRQLLSQIATLVSEAVANLGLSLGNVIGPVGALDGEVALFNGTTGRLLRRGLAFWKMVIGINTFNDLQSTSATVGQIVRTAWHTNSAAGGGGVYVAVAGTLTNDGGTQIPSATAGVSWKRQDVANLSLYDFGGSFEGNCVAAMNLALASSIEQIKVPNNVILGSHTFDATKKIIIGGNSVSFTGVGAGFRPRDVELLNITGFTNIVMSPLVADAHQFFAPAPNADHGVVIVCRNSGGGGIGGVIAAYENGRTIRQIYISENDFNDQIGEDGGQGYGIQYANENTTGDAWIMNNKVTRAGRHSYYIARNQSRGRVVLGFNKAIDHRENSIVTRGSHRPAFEISRSQNVIGFGNEVDGFYDCAFDVQDEPIGEDPVSPIQSHNVQFYGTVIRRPKNTIEAIRFGGQTPENDGLRSVKFIGVDFESDGIRCPVAAFNYGHDLVLSNVSARYKNITSGNIRPVTFNSSSAANSFNHVVENIYVQAVGCTGAVLDVFRMQGGACTAQIPIRIGGLSVQSDTTTTNTFSTATAIDNLLIELREGVNSDGLVFTPGVFVARSIAKSLPFNGRTSAASLTTPVGTFTPLFFGEEFYLSNNTSFWKANGLTNANWLKLTP